MHIREYNNKVLGKSASEKGGLRLKRQSLKVRAELQQKKIVCFCAITTILLRGNICRNP